MYDQAAMATRKPFKDDLLPALAALEEATGDRWTDLRLANLLGVTPSTVLRWRLGKNEPDTFRAVAMLAKLRKAARKRPPA